MFISQFSFSRDSLILFNLLSVPSPEYFSSKINAWLSGKVGLFSHSSPTKSNSPTILIFFSLHCFSKSKIVLVAITLPSNPSVSSFPIFFFFYSIKVGTPSSPILKSLIPLLTNCFSA